LSFKDPTPTKLSLAIPVYNEQDALPLLLSALRQTLAALPCDHEIVFVDDGSTDDSLAILTREAVRDPRIKILRFSRNFGHQAAITAAIDFSSGDAVVTMDADLQDPPELLPSMWDLFLQGYEVVSPQRIARDGETWLKCATATLFYRTMSALTGGYITRDVGDFRLLSRSAAAALRQMREQHRFIRGMVGWLGLREALLPFHRPARAAGRTKYHWWMILRLSWTAITSFSALPLRLTLTVGTLASGVAILYFLYAVLRYFRKEVVWGWTSIVFLQCFFFGVTLLSLGIVGQYIARIYEESKGRPLYVLSGTMNLDPESVNVARAVLLRSNPADVASL
jgi:glycosyltransferase involved in cell wall biosynthesis